MNAWYVVETIAEPIAILWLAILALTFAIRIDRLEAIVSKINKNPEED